LTFNPRLPAYISSTTPVSTISGTGNKLPASVINSTNTRVEKLTVAADGATLPIVYGEAQVPAQVFAVTTSGSNLVLGVAWCHGEVDSVIQVLLDGAPPLGATITNYTGTQSQLADATLSANISGYTDSLLGIAYSVISIPTSYSKIPKITGVIRGKKIYDPRTDITAYSDNTALCLNDFITNKEYGCGMLTSNVSSAANFNDDFMPSGDKRCQIGIALTRTQKSWSYVQLLAEYAECFIALEGDVVKLIPDRRELSSFEYNSSNILAGSLSMSVGDVSSIPNSIEVRYTDKISYDEPWGVVSESLKLPDINLGDISEILSSVSLDGIFRETEAYRKAFSRLYRPFISGNYTWSSFDLSVTTQVGDVVSLIIPDMGLNVLVRVMSVSLVAEGRYQFTGVRYSDNAYPEENFTPPETTVVPVGAIVIKLEGDTPTGWEDFTLADGKYLRGSSDTITGEGGDSQYNLSDVSSLGGAHQGSVMNTLLGGSVDIVGGDTNPTTQGGIEDVHSHTVSATIAPSVKTKEFSLVRATTTHNELPSNFGVLTGKLITDNEYQQITTINSHLLKAGTNQPTKGSYTTSVQITTDDIPNHLHAPVLDGKVLGDSTDIVKFDYVEAGGHNHIVNVDITTNPIRSTVLLYTASGDFPLRQGVILPVTEGTQMPSGWSVCDGTLGTPDLRGRFVEITNSSTTNIKQGDNSLSWTGLTLASGGHEHEGDFLPLSTDIYESVQVYHGNITGSHTHVFSGTDTWEPEWVALDFYQFTGVET